MTTPFGHVRQQHAGDAIAAAISRLSAEPDVIGRNGRRDLVRAREWTTLLNHVVEFRLGDDDEVIFLKAARNREAGDDLAIEWQRTESVRRFFDDVRPALDCVEPIAYYADLGVLAVRGCGRRPLAGAIRSACKWLTPAAALRRVAAKVHAAGRWSRHLEKVSQGVASASEARDQLLNSCVEAQAKIASAECGWRFGHVTAACRELLEAVPATSRIPVCVEHGDFQAGNLFVTDGSLRVTAIDFRLTAPRFQGYDALYFEHQLRASLPPARFSQRRARRLLDAFWSGYGSRPDGSSAVVKGMQAYLVLAWLVYLAGLARDASCVRKTLYYVDARRQAGWLTT